VRKISSYTFMPNLNLKRVEVDEIWSYIKKAKKCVTVQPTLE
jgi:hypothetical protein